MKIISFTLMIGLLMMMTCVSFGQSSMNTPNTSSTTQMKASVQPGPVLRRGMPASADIFVGQRLALRIAAPAGGLSPMQRARVIAGRMNQAFAEGFTWQDMRVSQVGKNWTLGVDGRIIATADTNSARMMGVSPGMLASNWGSQTVVALGGQPSMIAMQLTPVTTAVAGSQQELAVTWATAPTKTVPLLNASTGESMGDVTVGGTSRSVNAVNAVVVYETNQNNAVVRVFVPITGTTTERITRVPGVGLVSFSSDMLPMTGMTMGSDMQTMVSQNATQWNTAINTMLSQNNVSLRADSKVVPLYSSDGQVIGAAQIVGNSKGVTNTQRVTTAMSDNMLQFKAMNNQGSAMSNVVVSAIIYMPSSTAPTTTTPTMPPSTTTPPSTPGTSGTSGEGMTPEGTSPSETVPPSGPPADTNPTP